MKWAEFTITTSAELVDPITNFLLEQGTQGVTEAGSLEEPQLVAYFLSEDSKTVADKLKTYFVELAKFFPGSKTPSFTERLLQDESWKDKYKEFYTAQKLSDMFFLLPAWDNETQVPEGMMVIRMEPGQAFGTGLHPSTRLCIGLIENVAEESPDFSAERVIDVGTGTGILAIVAKKLGAKDIDATDIDPVAIETAEENLPLNDSVGIRLSTQPLFEYKTPYDLVISNILLETHSALAKEYAKLTKPGGHLILSGLLGNQKEEILSLIQPLGFSLLVSKTYQEWAAFLFVRAN